MAKLYKADGTVEEVKPKNGKVFSLDELQGFVGGNIELVPIYQNEGDRFVMFVNEEGKLKGLPINLLATVISGLNPDDVIVGDAIVCTLAEAGE